MSGWVPMAGAWVSYMLIVLGLSSVHCVSDVMMRSRRERG